MKIQIEIKAPELDDDYGKYEFVINEEGYIDLHIDNMKVDTIEDFSKFTEGSIDRLDFVVDYLVKSWRVSTRNKKIVV